MCPQPRIAAPASSQLYIYVLIPTPIYLLIATTTCSYIHRSRYEDRGRRTQATGVALRTHVVVGMRADVQGNCYAGYVVRYMGQILTAQGFRCKLCLCMNPVTQHTTHNTHTHTHTHTHTYVLIVIVEHLQSEDSIVQLPQTQK